MLTPDSLCKMSYKEARKVKSRRLCPGAPKSNSRTTAEWGQQAAAGPVRILTREREGSTAKPTLDTWPAAAVQQSLKC